jgi:hypothetical protein
VPAWVMDPLVFRTIIRQVALNAVWLHARLMVSCSVIPACQVTAATSAQVKRMMKMVRNRRGIGLRVFGAFRAALFAGIVGGAGGLSFSAGVDLAAGEFGDAVGKAVAQLGDIGREGFV